MLMQSNENYAVIGVYSNMERAERVVRALCSARVRLDRLSILGRCDPQQAMAVSQPLRFGAWGMLSSSAVMDVSRLGLIGTAGFFVSLLNEFRTQFGPDTSPIWTALQRLVVSEEVAHHLEAEISVGYWLVMARGERTETARVERYLQVLQGGAIMVYHSNTANTIQQFLPETSSRHRVKEY